MNLGYDPGSLGLEATRPHSQVCIGLPHPSPHSFGAWPPVVRLRLGREKPPSTVKRGPVHQVDST